LTRRRAVRFPELDDLVAQVVGLLAQDDFHPVVAVAQIRIRHARHPNAWPRDRAREAL
jgi:hypothetical protein